VRSQPGERIRVLIIDDIAETRENLRKLLSFDADIEVVGAAASGPEGIELTRQFRPHVVLMDINMPGMDGITATEEILQELPATQVVILSVQGESDYLRRAMMAGARDFLTKPPSGDELMSTIRKVYEIGKARAVAQPVVSAMAPTERPASLREGAVVAVFSPKGGVGCTTVAVNLAVALQQMVGSSQRIALVDTNLQFGDVGVTLNLHTSRSMADLVSHFEELDRDLLRSVLTPHSSGLKVLLAPPRPEDAESVLASVSSDEETTGNTVLRPILGLMREEFDIIVVDMWSWIDEVALTVFDAATMIVLVVTPNIPAIKSARLFLEVVDQLSYPVDKIVLAVNGVDRRMGIRVEQIEQALVPVAVQIPLDEPVVLAAANHGVPFVMRDQSRPVSQSIMQLAEHVQSMLAQSEDVEEEKAEELVATGGTGLLRLGRIFAER